MPNSVHHRHQASFGQSNTSQNFPSAQTSSHPVPQSYGQPSPVQHASYTSAPQTPVHSNQTHEGNQCSGNTVTADQVDALMKYFEAANFATSGFLDILADAGEVCIICLLLVNFYYRSSSLCAAITVPVLANDRILKRSHYTNFFL